MIFMFTDDSIVVVNRNDTGQTSAKDKLCQKYVMSLTRSLTAEHPACSFILGRKLVFISQALLFTQMCFSTKEKKGH